MDTQKADREDAFTESITNFEMITYVNTNTIYSLYLRAPSLSVLWDLGLQCPSRGLRVGATRAKAKDRSKTSSVMDRKKMRNQNISAETDMDHNQDQLHQSLAKNPQERPTPQDEVDGSLSRSLYPPQKTVIYAPLHVGETPSSVVGNKEGQGRTEEGTLKGGGEISEDQVINTSLYLGRGMGWEMGPYQHCKYLRCEDYRGVRGRLQNDSDQLKRQSSRNTGVGSGVGSRNGLLPHYQ